MKQEDFYDPKVKSLMKLIDADTKRKEANLKFRNEVKKLQIASKIRQQEAQAKQTIKTQTPEQQYLARRAKEQNPLWQMVEMTEDPSQPFETSMPAEEIVQDTRGAYTPKAVEPGGKKAMLAFMTAYDKAVQSGKTPHPVATKLYEKIKAKVNQGEVGKESSVTGETPTMLKRRIDYLENEVESTPENDALLEETRREYEKAIGIRKPEREDSSTQGMESDQTDDVESTIQENMQYYGKSREEIISALKRKGII